MKAFQQRLGMIWIFLYQVKKNDSQCILIDRTCYPASFPIWVDLVTWSLYWSFLFVVQCLGWSLRYMVAGTVPLVLQWVHKYINWAASSIFQSLKTSKNSRCLSLTRDMRFSSFHFTHLVKHCITMCHALSADILIISSLFSDGDDDDGCDCSDVRLGQSMGNIVNW